MSDTEQLNTEQTAPSKKAELEERKIQLEILELEKSWYKKPAFFVPIVGAFSSIFILWVTGFFSTKIETLTTKRDQLNFETSRLKETKDQLKQDSIYLETVKKSLQVDTIALSNKIKSVTQQYDSVKGVLAKNREEAVDIKNTNAILNNQINNKQIELSKLSDSLANALKPNLEINLHKIFVYEDMDIGIYITNTGTGPAYFKNVNYYYKGKSFIGTEKDDDFWDKVIEALGLYRGYLNWTGKQLSSDINKAGALGPGQNYATLKIAKTRSDYNNIQTFLKAIVGLEIEIKYQSASGKEFVNRHMFSEEECAIK
jgi:hypothetical protein